MQQKNLDPQISSDFNPAKKENTIAENNEHERIHNLSQFKWPAHIVAERSTSVSDVEENCTVVRAGSLLFGYIVVLLDDRLVTTKKITKEILVMLIDGFKKEWESGAINRNRYKVPQDIENSDAKENDCAVEPSLDAVLTAWAMNQVEDQKSKTRIVKEIKSILVQQANTTTAGGKFTKPSIAKK